MSIGFAVSQYEEINSRLNYIAKQLDDMWKLIYEIKEELNENKEELNDKR